MSVRLYQGDCLELMKDIPDGSVDTGALRKFGSVIGPRPSHVAEYVQTETNYPRAVLDFDNG